MHRVAKPSLKDNVLGTYFWSTLVPMIIASCFYLLEAIEEAFYKPKKYDCWQMFFMILCFPIWPVYSLFLSSWAIFKSKTNSRDPEEEEEILKECTKMSNHGHLIEVSTESALQPLIQLYTIYIGLIMSSDLSGIDTNWQALLDAMMNKNWIQIFAILQGSKYITQALSFISSVASIAWSFQANYARK